MQIEVFEKREDGSLIIENPIIADADNIPEGLYKPEKGKVYEYNPPIEIEPQEEPTETERLEALEMLMVDILGGGF